MGAVSFGSFSMIDVHGSVVGAVVIAPEFVLLQRPRSSTIHDLSYLAVWSAQRIDAINRELSGLAASERIVDQRTPELAAILRAIDPTATALFCRIGECRRTFARRRLKAALGVAVIATPSVVAR